MSTSRSKSHERVGELVDQLVASYRVEVRTRYIDSPFLPSRAGTIQIVELTRQLVFPGFFDEQRLVTETIQFNVGELLTRLRHDLFEQVRQALHYEANRVGSKSAGAPAQATEEQARSITTAVLGRLNEVRRLLALDVQAAYDGDPAAVSIDETIFCYPGIFAIFAHRLAHELYLVDVPLLPRIISEFAHSQTGIDIHPGARIGESFFIDHGTGVVIGQTTEIGNRVQIYQGVTLGAMAPSDGQTWRGRKRHPTIEDDVTIYGGAIILGGETVIGRGAEIGGAVFLTGSIPAFHKVRMKRTELEIEASSRLQRRAEVRQGS